MNDPINPYAPPQANIVPPPAGGNERPLASRGKRCVATLIDGLIILAITLPIEWMSGAFDRAPDSTFALRLEDVFWSALAFGIMAMVNWNLLLNGQTIGKRLFEIQVVRRDGRICDRKHNLLWRMLPLQIVVLIPLVGLLVAIADCLSIFRSSRLTFHDDVADTKVVDAGPWVAA